MPERVTIREVAEYAGVSKSAVSIVLRNRIGVSDETRRRVQAAIESLGYVPDPALSRIASARWRSGTCPSQTTLAFVRTAPTMRAPSYLGARKKAEELGYRVDTIDLGEGVDFEVVARVVRRRGIQGVLLPTLEEGLGFARADWSGCSLVSLGRGKHFFPVHGVGHDIFENARYCWRCVSELGYRRIGVAPLRHEPAIEDDAARFGALSYGVEIEREPSDRIPVLFSSLWDRRAFEQWYRTHRPEVVISFGSAQLNWLIEMGVRVPDDCAFACLHAGTARMRGRSVAGTLNAPQELGRVGVGFLDQLMRANQTGLPEEAQTIRIRMPWVDGDSCPRRI